MNDSVQHIQTIVEKYYQIEIVKDPYYFKRQQKKKQYDFLNKSQNRKKEAEEKK